MNKSTQPSVFDQLTNRYSLQKTLRFELRSTPETKAMLEANGIIQADEKRQKNYQATKPFLDRLHQEFITDALSSASLESLKGYEEIYGEWKSNPKDKEFKKQLESKEKEIRKEIVQLFDAKAAEWIDSFSIDGKFKKTNHQFLREPAVFEVLEKKYGHEPEAKGEDGKSIFASWAKWNAYFGKYFETRDNFYKDDGTATAVATRIVNDNLRRFCDNKADFVKLAEKLNLAELDAHFGKSIIDCFEVEFYSGCLTQPGIDRYNELIGGDKRVTGINQLINEYKQNTGQKLPRLKQLDKQIGSEQESRIIVIDSDSDLEAELMKLVDTVNEKVHLLDRSIKYLMDGSAEPEGIYFRKEAINTISRRWFASYENFLQALVAELNAHERKSASYDEKKQEYKFPDFISWKALRGAVEQLFTTGEQVWKQHYIEKNVVSIGSAAAWDQFMQVLWYEYTLAKNGFADNGDVTLEDCANTLVDILKTNKPEQLRDHTEVIKNYCDRVLGLQRFAKYFSLEKKRQWNNDNLKTDDFYVDYLAYYTDSFEGIVKPYDRIRNYLTKKPFNTDKWKLNFNCSSILSGWDSELSTYASLLFEKNNQYYLGLVNGQSLSEEKRKSLFDGLDLNNSARKMVYHFQKPDFRNAPRLFIRSKGDRFAPAVKEYNLPVESILEIYDNGLFKTENRDHPQYKESLVKMIDYFKMGFSRHQSYDGFTFKWKNSIEYHDISEFYDDTSRSCYEVTWEQINFDKLLDLNRDGDVYLFKIHNKDFSKGKVGVDSIHTSYFKSLFSFENTSHSGGVVNSLNGSGEIFFREKTSNLEKCSIVTKYNEVTLNKGDKAFVKNRFTEDKIFLHFPISLNYSRSIRGSYESIVNNLLADNPDINIIGIDRGEKHLAYLSVINQKGEILEIESLNKINGIDYAQKLEERAKERESARRDWKGVEQIKDLKRGYVSHVVRRIADLIIQYNAIVVFEDLNMRFKQVRGGIEKSIYQQLEKALIDKLNFLVDKKEMDPKKAGHVLRAYQLTAPFESFQKMGKQTGVLFYTQAEYTSQTDPVTGFRKNLYMSNSSTAEKVKSFIKNFDKIGWDSSKGSYFFEYNPINFADAKYKDQVLSKTWRVYANVPRIRREKVAGYWQAKPINPNVELRQLFEKWSFNNLEAKDMLEQIWQLAEEGALAGTRDFDGQKRNFWSSFIYLFNLILQLRNSTAAQYKKNEQGEVIETVEGVDFISSPVEPFFCTEGGEFTKGYVNMAGMEKRYIGDPQKREDFAREFNGDANGAYNIARKGLIILEKIKNNETNLFIGREEWDVFATRQDR